MAPHREPALWAVSVERARTALRAPCPAGLPRGFARTVGAARRQRCKFGNPRPYLGHLIYNKTKSQLSYRYPVLKLLLPISWYSRLWYTHAHSHTLSSHRVFTHRLASMARPGKPIFSVRHPDGSGRNYTVHSLGYLGLAVHLASVPDGLPLLENAVIPVGSSCAHAARDRLQAGTVEARSFFRSAESHRLPCPSSLHNRGRCHSRPRRVRTRV